MLKIWHKSNHPHDLQGWITTSTTKKQHSKDVLHINICSLMSDPKAALLQNEFSHYPNTGLFHPQFQQFYSDNFRYPRSWREGLFVTFFCIILSSSLRLMFTFISCWIFTSEATKAFLTCIYSWAVTGPSDKSESKLYEKEEKNTYTIKKKETRSWNFNSFSWPYFKGIMVQIKLKLVRAINQNHLKSSRKSITSQLRKKYLQQHFSDRILFYKDFLKILNKELQFMKDRLLNIQCAFPGKIKGEPSGFTALWCHPAFLQEWFNSLGHCWSAVSISPVRSSKMFVKYHGITDLELFGRSNYFICAIKLVSYLHPSTLLFYIEAFLFLQ